MEFHAIILCGPGRQLVPLSKERATGVPKALLPVANKPMVNHVLDWCERAFFSKVTIVCTEDSEKEIQASIEDYKQTKLIDSVDSGNVEAAQYIQSIDVKAQAWTSSGAVIPEILKSTQFDQVVIMPCDFLTDLPPQVLIEAYRNRADLDAGMLVSYKNTLDIEDKKSKIFPKSFTVYAENSVGEKRFLDYYTTEDVNFHKAFKLRTKMLWKHPKAVVTTSLLSSSIFLMDVASVRSLIESNESKFSDSYFSSRSLIKAVRDMARRSWQSSNKNASIGLMVVPEQASFMRLNNIPVLMEATRYILKSQVRENLAKSQAPREKTAANVGADSLVSISATLGERTNVKRSVVGPNCAIGKRVKLTGSIVMLNVTIEDDAQLENVVIGAGAIIGAKSKLVNSTVEATHSVPKGLTAKNDILSCLTLEGLVDDAIESSSEEDTSSEESYDEYVDEYGDNDDGLFGY